MEIAQLSKVYSAGGGRFVSVYVDDPIDVEDAAVRTEITVKNVERELAGRAVDDATRAAVTAAIADRSDAAGATHAVIASHGQVHLDAWLPAPARGEPLTVGPLPSLFPLVASLVGWPSHVVVLTDRTGADVIGYTGDGAQAIATSTGDEGYYPVHKTGTGGWAAKRYDASVEESWEHSAADVAALVAKVAADLRADLVVISGDDRAVSLLREHLPPALSANVVVVPGGGRHHDGGEEHVAKRVTEAVAEKVAENELALLARFQQAQGREVGARDGLADVVAALRMGEVDTVVLSHSIADDSRELWFGPEPGQVAMTETEMADLGVEAPQRGAAVDVLLHAAVLTGSSVAVVSDSAPGAPREGIGALLRFDVTPGR